MNALPPSFESRADRSTLGANATSMRWAVEARAAILSLLPPAGTLGPPRSA